MTAYTENPTEHLYTVFNGNAFILTLEQVFLFTMRDGLNETN
jgi:hypothetical protein